MKLKLCKRFIVIEAFLLVCMLGLFCIIKYYDGIIFEIAVAELVASIVIMICVPFFIKTFYYSEKFISINSFKIDTYKNLDAYIYGDNIWVVPKMYSKKLKLKQRVKIIKYYNIRKNETYKLCKLPSINY